MVQIRKFEVVNTSAKNKVNRTIKNFAMAAVLSTGIIASAPAFSQSQTLSKTKIPDSAYVEQKFAADFMKMFRAAYVWLSNGKDSLYDYNYKFTVRLKLDTENPTETIYLKDNVVLTKKIQRQLGELLKLGYNFGIATNKTHFFIYRESGSSGYLDVHLKVDSDR